MASPSRVLIRLTASAPAASAANAISVMLVTLGVSLTQSGFWVLALTAETTSSIIGAELPKAMQPLADIGTR